jgi:NRPS condensation-like uncharacterized protein
MVVHDSDAMPMSTFSYLLFSGNPDLEALKVAVRTTQRTFPQLASGLVEKRIGFQHLLLRVPLESPPGLEVLSELADGLGERTVLQAVSDLMEPKVLSRMDLHNGPPVRFYLAVLPESRYAMIVHFHHAGSDAGMMMAMLRVLFASYHQQLTGEKPAWAQAESMGASRDAAMSRVPNLTNIRDMMAEGRALKKDPLLLLNRKTEFDSPKRRMEQFALTEEESRRLLASARAQKATVNDLLACAVVETIDQMRSSPEGTQSIWMPVNLRPPVPDTAIHCNDATSINVNLVRAQRTDRKRLLKAFTERRKALLKMGRHEFNYRMLRRVLWFSHFRPLHKREEWLRKLFMGQPITFMLSNTGVMWPKRVDGKLTPETYLNGAGGLTIEKYEMNFPNNDSLGQGMVAYSFNGRFNALFSVYDGSLTYEESATFMDGVHDRLVE